MRRKSPSANLAPRHVTLRDGREALARPLGAGDEPALLDFFAALSPATIHARYGYLIKNMSPDHAHRLAAVDWRREAALGVFSLPPPGKLLAMGRLVHAPDDLSAECAFVVRDDCRRLGLASTLLTALRLLGRRRGIPRLFAQVRRENHAMLGVFRQIGARLHFSPDGDIVEVDIPLQ